VPAPYSPVAFANWFIVRFPDGITHLKVQKLVYCAYGWWLAYNYPEEVLAERPEVWKHGPVFRDIYSSFSGNGDRPIRNVGRVVNSNLSAFVDDADHRVNNLLEFTLERYGHMHEFKLSDMTHKEGTPWQQMAARYDYRVPRNLMIDRELIRDEFQKIARENNLFEHAEAAVEV